MSKGVIEFPESLLIVIFIKLTSPSLSHPLSLCLSLSLSTSSVFIPSFISHIPFSQVKAVILDPSLSIGADSQLTKADVEKLTEVDFA